MIFIKSIIKPQNNFATIDYSDCEVSDNTQQQPQQEQSPQVLTATPLALKVTALKSVKLNKIRNNRRHPVNSRRISKERKEVQTAHSNNNML